MFKNSVRKGDRDLENSKFNLIYHKRLDQNLLDDYDNNKARIAEIKRFMRKLLLSKNLNFLIGSCRRIRIAFNRSSSVA